MKHEHMSRSGRFERLSRIRDLTVASDQPDPRGWKVVDVERRTVGEVKDLVVDMDRMKAAYLDVELDAKAFDLHRDPHVLVPMTRAQRDGDHRRLLVEGLTRERIAELRIARESHMRDFWDRWWEVNQADAGRDWSPNITRTAAHADLQRALDNVRPGETVRIPVVHEEIVVERRVVHPEDAQAPAIVPSDERITR